MNGTRTKLVVATSNRGKLAEFRTLLGDLPVDLVAASEVLGEGWSVVEDGETFEDNAIKKATEVASQAKLLTLADDSGLEVDALGGAPGIRSARYAGEQATSKQNVHALLSALEGVPDRERQARFRCVLCVVDPLSDGQELVLAHGTCEGRIARAPRGTEGFGYDPVFVVEGGERTMAELTAEEKGQVSHRARTVMGLRRKLERLVCR